MGCLRFRSGGILQVASARCVCCHASRSVFGCAAELGGFEPLHTPSPNPSARFPADFVKQGGTPRGEGAKLVLRKSFERIRDLQTDLESEHRAASAAASELERLRGELAHEGQAAADARAALEAEQDRAAGRVAQLQATRAKEVRLECCACVSLQTTSNFMVVILRPPTFLFRPKSWRPRMPPRPRRRTTSARRWQPRGSGWRRRRTLPSSCRATSSSW